MSSSPARGRAPGHTAELEPRLATPDYQRQPVLGSGAQLLGSTTLHHLFRHICYATMLEFACLKQKQRRGLVRANWSVQ